MNVWQKIKGYVIAFFVGIGTLLGIFAIWSNRNRYNQATGSETDNQGAIDRERQISDALAGSGKAIAGSVGRVDRIETIIGDNAERQSETANALDKSRIVHDRAEKFLADNPD